MGLLLTSQDDTHFERVGVFSYENWLRQDSQDFEVVGPSGYQSRAEEQRAFFKGCEFRTIIVV